MSLPNKSARDPGMPFAITSLLIAIGCILVQVNGFVALYNEPVGAACRPMGLAVAFFVAGIAGPLTALLLAAVTFFRGRSSRWIALVGGALSLVPLPMHVVLYHWIVSTHQLVIEP
jgi:hypothetical protein